MNPLEQLYTREKSSGEVPLVRFRVCFLFISVVNVWMNNLRPDGAIRWKVYDRWMGRSGSGVGKPALKRL
jgi:hypothetical protein